MSDQLAEALGEEPPAPETPVEEAPVEPQEIEAQQEQPEEPEAEPPQEEVKEPTMVPLPALLAERDKVKQIEQSLIELKAQVLKQQPEPEIPDVLMDQEGFVSSFDQRVAAALANNTANMSQAFAEQQHGKEAVAAALEALQASGDQFADQRIRSDPMPYQALMTWHAQQAILQEIGSDPKAYKEKLEAEAYAKAQARMVAEQSKAAAGAPAPTLAGQANMGNRSGPGFTPPTLEGLIGS